MLPADPEPLISVVVVSYNSSDDLAALLPTLRHDRLEVLVVDNASVDGSASVAEEHGATILRLSDNVGWSAGCNRGAEAAEGPVLAFVNPDARPSPEQLLAMAERLSPAVASVSPRFLEADGSTSPFYFRYPGPLSGLMTFTSAGRRLDLLLGEPFMRRRLYDRQPERAGQPDQPGAACLVVDAALFAASGGFDESLFLFFADAAWCRETRAKGHHHMTCWDIGVLHPGGGSVKQLPSATSQRMFVTDYLGYARRSYGPAGRLVTLIGLLGLSVTLPTAAAVARRDWPEARARLALAATLLRTAHTLGR